MPADGGDAEEVLLEFAAGGVDVDALAARLQSEGAASFVESWEELIAAIESKASLVGTIVRLNQKESQCSSG